VKPQVSRLSYPNFIREDNVSTNGLTFLSGNR
jgi:hypothetical protein